MSDLILGLIAVVLVGLFFGFYTVTLGSLPLAIIFLAIFALVVVEFIQSVRKGKDKNQD